MAFGTAPRIALASLTYETNSFAPGLCTMDTFRGTVFAEGAQLFTIGRGIDEIAGAMSVASAAGIEVVPTTAAGGLAGPIVSAAAYAELRERFLAGLSSVDDIDGVYLRLHGAMVTEDEQDVEGDLVDAVRSLIGSEVPIAISCDLHCHFTARMAAATDLIVGYQTCPHTDFVATGERAMRLLHDRISGAANPVLRYRKIRMMASSEGHDTDHGPIREVMDRLHEMTTEPGVMDATVFLTQPWLDVRELGWAALVVTDDQPELAQERADELAAMLWDRRERVLFRKTPIDVALAEVRSSAPEQAPFVLADGADSCSAGSPGDGVALLERLLAEPIEGESVVVVTDAAAVQTCLAVGIGAEVDLTVGASLTPRFFAPVHLRARVGTLCDGHYQSKYPPAEVELGPMAAVRTASGINVIITSRPAAQLDLEVFLRAGLNPRDVKLVQVKSAGGFRAFFEPFAFKCIDLATPGPADSRLPRLPFTQPARPLFPFDQHIEEPFLPV